MNGGILRRRHASCYGRAASGRVGVRVEVSGGVRLVSHVRFPVNVDMDAIRDAVDWTDLGRRIRVAAEDAVELVGTHRTHVRGGASAMRSGGQAESDER